MRSITYARGFRLVAANALAVFSFVLFAVAVLWLHQGRSVPFVVEDEQPVPVVLSHYLLGTKNGFVDSGLTRYFRQIYRTVPAEEAIERALKADIKPTHDLALTTDGDGIGPILMVRAAFALFGVRASALAYLFVLVLGISTTAFVLRFQDRRIFAIPVLFTAFTALTLSPLTSADVAAQAPLGGMRSYAIVGILATLHWCFEIVANSFHQRRGWIARSILVSIQIAILGFAILVRHAPVYLLAPPFAVGVYSLGWHWDWAGVRAALLRVVFPAVALAAVLLSITPIAYPEYARAGRAFSAVWERLFISFGAHPAWPFAGLRERYPCPEIPEGLTPGVGVDRNAHCVWWTYVRGHHIPVETADRETYGAEYERVLRNAVWYVAKTYPKETFETFFIFKPELVIKNALTMLLKLHAPDGRRLPVALFVLQCAILIVFMSAWQLDTALADIRSGASLLSLFLAFSLAPQIVAWAAPWTASDFIVYAMCMVILGFWSVLAAAMVKRRRLGRALIGPPRLPQFQWATSRKSSRGLAPAVVRKTEFSALAQRPKD